MTVPYGVTCGWFRSATSLHSGFGLPALPITLFTGAAKSSFLKTAKFARQIRAGPHLSAGQSLIRTRFRPIREHQLAAPLRQPAESSILHIARYAIFFSPEKYPLLAAPQFLKRRIIV